MKRIDRRDARNFAFKASWEKARKQVAHFETLPPSEWLMREEETHAAEWLWPAPNAEDNKLLLAASLALRSFQLIYDSLRFSSRGFSVLSRFSCNQVLHNQLISKPERFHFFIFCHSSPSPRTEPAHGGCCSCLLPEARHMHSLPPCPPRMYMNAQLVNPPREHWEH